MQFLIKNWTVFFLCALFFSLVGCGGGIEGTNTGEGRTLTFEFVDENAKPQADLEVKLNPSNSSSKDKDNNQQTAVTDQNGIVQFTKVTTVEEIGIASKTANTTLDLRGLLDEQVDVRVLTLVTQTAANKMIAEVVEIEKTPSSPQSKKSKTKVKQSLSPVPTSVKSPASSSSGGNSNGGQSGSGGNENSGGNKSGNNTGGGGSAVPTATPTPTATFTPIPQATEVPSGAIIEVSLSSIDFGDVEMGESYEISLEIYNSGEQDLVYNPSISPASNSISILAFDSSVAPGAQTSLRLKFAPKNSGLHSATLVIESNASNDPTLEIPVEGVGTLTPLEEKIKISPSSLDFNVVGVGKTASESLEVKNVGFAPLLITNVTLKGPDKAHFRYTLEVSGKDYIQPGETTSILVSFEPTSTGIKKATLEIESSDPNNPVVEVPLKGSGMGSL